VGGRQALQAATINHPVYPYLAADFANAKLITRLKE
jgi:hypothetical protein